MQTRTELILLQRTMVVVEGVARSLNPHEDIWADARPVVEEYIQHHIGPAAVLRDLARTVRVLSRFGPRLPQLAEDLLVRQSAEPPAPPSGLGWAAAGVAVIGAAIGAAALAGILFFG
jgi:ubiquinone biosynthesis protein